MSTPDYPKTPEHLMVLGFSAGLFGLLAFPLLPLAYWLGKLDWRHRWRVHQMPPPDRWSEFWKGNGFRMVFFSIPVTGFLAGPDMVNAWYIQGLRAAANEGE